MFFCFWRLIWWVDCIIWCGLNFFDFFIWFVDRILMWWSWILISCESVMYFDWLWWEWEECKKKVIFWLVWWDLKCWMIWWIIEWCLWVRIEIIVERKGSIVVCCYKVCSKVVWWICILCDIILDVCVCVLCGFCLVCYGFCIINLMLCGLSGIIIVFWFY